MSKANGIGCKGGTSATAGMKASVYVVTLPDGTTARVRKFMGIREAWSACYKPPGSHWRAGSYILADRPAIEAHISSGPPGYEYAACRAVREVVEPRGPKKARNWCLANGWAFVTDSDVLEAICGEREGIAHVATIDGRDCISDSVYGDWAACYAENGPEA